MTSGELLRETGSIYALTTPQGTPFYVGATMQRPRERVMQHLRLALRGECQSETHELLAEVRRCGFWVLEYGVGPEQLGARETHHIERLRDAGFEMLNYEPGGHGCHRQPVHIRKRIGSSAARRPRGPRGEFVSSLPLIAGAALTPAEQFMGAGEL